MDCERIRREGDERALRFAFYQSELVRCLVACFSEVPIPNVPTDEKSKRTRVRGGTKFLPGMYGDSDQQCLGPPRFRL